MRHSIDGGSLAAISRWIDESPGYVDIDPEAHLRRRLGKIDSESGEVQDALARLYGENPRKPEATGTLLEVVEETLDCAVAALGAVEHMTGNHGSSVRLLAAKIDKVLTRAGLLPWRPNVALPGFGEPQAHDLTVRLGDEELLAVCSCGADLPTVAMNRSEDVLTNWERHVMTS